MLHSRLTPVARTTPSPDPKLPLLVIVAGRPGAGKSTLARQLAKRIHCPLISRDAIKEGLVNTLGAKGPPGGPLAVEAMETFFAVIQLLLERRVTLVIDAFFPQELWDRHIDTLKPIAHIKLIFCEVDLESAHQRMLQRKSETNIGTNFTIRPSIKKPCPPRDTNYWISEFPASSSIAASNIAPTLKASSVSRNTKRRP